MRLIFIVFFIWFSDFVVIIVFITTCMDSAVQYTYTVTVFIVLKDEYSA